MGLWGTLVNVLAILAGAFVGIVIGTRLPQRLIKTVTQATGLGILLIGMIMAVQTKKPILVIIGLVAGAVTGELLNLEGLLNNCGRRLEKLVAGRSGGEISRAFVSASLLYCVGAMAIMGSLEAGLKGSYTILYAKAVLDGILAVTMAAIQGWGIALASVSVLLYQGSLTIMASWLQGYLTAAVVNEITACGGLLLIAIAFGVLEIKEMHVGNLLPALLFVALLTLLGY